MLPMSQKEYDAADAVRLHLIDREVAEAEGLTVALCSGLAYDPFAEAGRVAPPLNCPACERVAFMLARRRMVASLASRN